MQALYGVDFDVRSGEVMALVGDNGAGKSTLIKGIAGIHAFDEGEIEFEGRPVDDPRPARRGRARDRGRLPGSRARRQPRRRREHVPRPGAGAPRRARRADDGGTLPLDARLALGDVAPFGAPSGGRALGRPAPGRRRREGGDVELEGRDPRRADGRARRRADAAGARPRASPRRPRSRRRDHLAQPPRHLRGRRPDHGAAARSERGRLRPRVGPRSRTSSTRSPQASSSTCRG